jgi:hypothetical protein
MNHNKQTQPYQKAWQFSGRIFALGTHSEYSNCKVVAIIIMG